MSFRDSWLAVDGYYCCGGLRACFERSVVRVRDDRAEEYGSVCRDDSVLVLSPSSNTAYQLTFSHPLSIHHARHMSHLHLTSDPPHLPHRMTHNQVINLPPPNPHCYAPIRSLKLVRSLSVVSSLYILHHNSPASPFSATQRMLEPRTLR